MPERATLRKREVESNKFEKLKFTTKLLSGNKLNTSNVKKYSGSLSNFIFSKHYNKTLYM